MCISDLKKLCSITLWSMLTKQPPSGPLPVFMTEGREQGRSWLDYQSFSPETTLLNSFHTFLAKSSHIILCLTSQISDMQFFPSEDHQQDGHQIWVNGDIIVHQGYVMYDSYDHVLMSGLSLKRALSSMKDGQKVATISSRRWCSQRKKSAMELLENVLEPMVWEALWYDKSTGLKVLLESTILWGQLIFN